MSKFNAALTIFKCGLREMAPMKAGGGGLEVAIKIWRLFHSPPLFALPAEHFGSLTDALRSRLPKGVIASALLSITMTDQGERERRGCKNVILSLLHFHLFRLRIACFITMTRHVTDRKDITKTDVGGLNNLKNG